MLKRRSLQNGIDLRSLVGWVKRSATQNLPNPSPNTRNILVTRTIPHTYNCPSHYTTERMEMGLICDRLLNGQTFEPPHLQPIGTSFIKR